MESQAAITPPLSAHSASEKKKVVIIGGGPVGALAALYFVKDGWSVEVYELRGDLRLPENRSLNFTKSINLALSERGISGMRAIDEKLLESVLAETIPMKGRMVHNTKTPAAVVEERRDTDEKFWLEGEKQLYDIHGQFIRSADRHRLNEQLLDRIAVEEDVKLFFNHGLKKLDLDKKFAVFEKRGQYQDRSEGTSVTVEFDLCIGADGAHSATRRHLQKYIRMDYEQVYIDTLWCELEIMPNEKTGDFRIDPNYLHIWPKQTFMFIAIPSPDMTFTCTLFMPQSKFDAIGTDPDKLIEFFETNFPSVIPLIGRERLINDYMKNSKLPLISLKCSPYHYKDRCVILGDAAHAMVPFYGQGMNAGFEDVRILFKYIHSYPTLLEAFEAYSPERRKDAHSINDLAMRNYIEMRSDVTSKMYLFKKAIEEFLYDNAPCLGFRTQYNMVSFSNIRYSNVIKAVRRQNQVLNATFWGVGLTALAACWIYGRRALGPGLGPGRGLGFSSAGEIWRWVGENVARVVGRIGAA